MTHSVIRMVQSMELSTKQNSSNNSNDNNQHTKSEGKCKEASKENTEKLISHLLYIQRIPHVYIFTAKVGVAWP